MSDAREDALPTSAKADLGIVLDLCQTLGSANDLASAFSRIMQVLAAQRHYQHACLLLLDDASGKLSTHAAFGLTPDEMAKGNYFVGEGVSGHVLATGRSRITPDVRQESDFLNRTGRYSLEHMTSAISFLCIPLRVEGRIVGTIWADKEFPGDAELRTDHAIMEILASMLSQSIRLDRLVFPAEGRVARTGKPASFRRPRTLSIRRHHR